MEAQLQRAISRLKVAEMVRRSGRRRIREQRGPEE
jgi:hypothetical protein